MSDFSHHVYRAAQIKCTVYMEMCALGDHLIMVMKKFQQAHLEGQQDCCLTRAFTNEAQGNRQMHTHQKLMPPFLSVITTLSKAISLQQHDPNTKNLLPL